MKVLAIIQGALGDGVMALWGLQAVANHTGCSLDLICNPGLGSLAKELGLARSFVSIQSSEIASLYGSAPSPEIKELIRSYDSTIVFSFSGELFNAVSSLSRHAVSIPPRPLPHEKTHVLDHLFSHLFKAGLTGYASLNEHKGLVSAFDLYAGVPNNAAFPILIHPGSGSTRKNWSLESFLELHASLGEKGFSCRFIRGPDDQAVNDRLLAANPEAVIERPETILEFKDCLLRAKAYVGNDSGATHVAAMLGVPTVALFGPSDPDRWKPIGLRVNVVRPELECAPCFEAVRENCPNPLCLQDISPGMVMGALDRILE